MTNVTDREESKPLIICPECKTGLINGDHSKLDVIFCYALFELKKEALRRKLGGYTN
ncbi:hypothetical protein [Nitrososphaeria virus YSH_922147]|uniref:Uncharacterized protein n=1 Tax=Nitrososphaeria virus YSH_922147 TaxID=3071323 RepID=A0A976YDZ9_9CAUD|nr:hypothetical protein QKV94_gp44 [Yangshan Harbor Nitrososphaeria virus]UVF62453.1 hypothetical protein [Nitrososphaeria virus YSH_922147]